MAEVTIKADVRAIRRWLIDVKNDVNMPESDRWLAGQTLNEINRLYEIIGSASAYINKIDKSDEED
jgi:hypothetical protein